jgi:hypothetical protein
METEQMFCYLPTLDTVVSFHNKENMGLLAAEKLTAPIFFYATPSSVGH